MNSTIEQRLFINSLRSRESESFMVLYEQCSRKIFSLAYKMTGSKEDAEDITQNSFLQAYRHIGQFKEESSITTWLYAIARNQCLRLLEDKKRSSFSALDELIHMANTKDTVPEITDLERRNYISQVKDGCLLGLLRCLSFYQRMAFVLHVLLQVDVKDVASVLDKSESATRTLIHRARHNIMDFLCKNCSLFDENNACHCENLIEFSLRQGWIGDTTTEKMAEFSRIETQMLEREIQGIKKIVLLYNSINDASPSEDMKEALVAQMRNQDYRIFSAKKVK